MNPEQLRKRTKDFALSVIKFCIELKRGEEIGIFKNQILRAGSSVGANYRAACRARSKKEFYSKLSIVVEETDETLYWLEILVESGLVQKEKVREIYKEGLELIKIFSSARKTTEEKLKAKN